MFSSICITTLLLAFLWSVMTDGSLASWLVGLPVLMAAVWASTRLNKPAGIKLSPVGLLKFIPFFLWESWWGGIDVALRTLAPQVRVQPEFIRYRMTLRKLPARIFFLNCLSLLPGTLAADLQDDLLEVHILNQASNPQAELQKLEHAIARLFMDRGDGG